MELLLAGYLLFQSAFIIFMAVDRRSERREHAVERAVLMQRIQAPELAVIEHQMRDVRSNPVPLEYDNDEAFHASREDMVKALELNGS